MKKCPETRVLIAKDVLKGLKNNHINPIPGIYLWSEALRSWENPEIIGKQVCELLKSKPCEVCAIGALFVGQVERFNKLEFTKDLYSDDLRAELTKAFSMPQLLLIEAAFEGWIEGKFDGSTFQKKYPDSTKRMDAIMRNIIKNNGTFIPNVK